MSTINTLQEMSGINQTSKLEITPERAQAVIDTVSANHLVQATVLPVTFLPVSTYVNESKEPDSGFAYVPPKQPPFASHWGVVVGDLSKHQAFLFHLLLEGDGAQRRVRLHLSNVDYQSRWITGAAVTPVGQTKYPIQVLQQIGWEMIEAFGNYHLVFWNCQMFAKCFLRVITGDDAVFTQWTSADVTNLFLCALVVPMPFSSTSKRKENRKMEQLRDIGIETANLAALGSAAEGREITDEELFKASDTVINLMKASWSDDETLKKLSRPMKDSADKVGLMTSIKSIMMKALGISS